MIVSITVVTKLDCAVPLAVGLVLCVGEDVAPTVGILPGGGGSTAPTVGMLPAKTELDSAHTSTNAIVNFFMDLLL